MHLYLHVPFCARRCSYCDFAIAVRRVAPSGEYRRTVLAEWGRWQSAPWWSRVGPIATIYFGGGTPSMLAPEDLAAVVAAIRGDRPVAGELEVTLEANPEDVTEATAAGWRAAGVTRVSLGVQSFDPAVLRWMHRIHDADRPAAAMAALRASGIDNVSVDLIYAVPAELGRSWDADLDRALALEPDHLSLYGLTVEDHTPLGKWVARGEAVPAPEGAAADQYLEASRRLTVAGFGHYEVSNAGRPGFESRHNLGYWRRAPYLGLGPSAHSAIESRRWWNEREWERYRARIEAGESAVGGSEELTPEQVRLEEVYLGLRTDRGLPASYLPPDEVERWISAGWADRTGSRVVLRPAGWLRLDALVSRVVEP